MSKIEDGEINRTMGKIMKYLYVELADGARFIPYRRIAKVVGCSYHSVKYSIDRLKTMSILCVENGKLSLG